MKKIGFLFTVSAIVFAIFITNFIMPVTAEGTNIIDGKNWSHSFTNGASGTFTSNDSSSFVADMSSIGSGEWDARVSMSGLSLAANTTYVYETDIKSDKNRYNNFVSLCMTNATCNGGLFTDYLVDFPKDKTVSVKRVFTPTNSYSNASIYFGFGKNGYEGDRVLANSANKIEVSDVKITKLSDYSWMLKNPDYTSYTYTTINPPEADYAHQDYAYAGVENINFAQAENRGEFGETIAVATTAGEVKSIDGKYQVYVNGKLITPPEAAAGWYHINYDDLDREYNEVWTLSVNNTFSTIIIKNGKVTNTKKQILNNLNTNYRIPNQNSSDAVKQIIEDAATAIQNAPTVQDAQAIYDELGDKIELQKYKEQKADEVSALNVTGINQVQRELIINALDDINAATTKTEIDNIVSEFMDAYNLENAKRLAKQEIDELVGTNPSSEVSTLAETAKNNIDAATTEAEVTQALDAGKTAILNQQALEQAKAEKSAEVRNAGGDNPSREVLDIIDQAIADIADATTVAAVESIADTALNAIRGQQTLEQTKENAKHEIDDLVGDNPSREILELANNAKQAIDNATTIDDVERALNNGKEAIRAQQSFEETKANAIDELNNLATSDDSQETLSLINDGLTRIGAATTVDEVNTILDEVKSSVALQRAKENAKREIDEIVGDNPSDEVASIAERAEQAIANATTVDEVNSILENAKNDISGRQSLEEVKEAAIKKIDSNIPNNASKEVKKIAEKAKEAINAATSKNEVNSILEKTLKDIEKQIAKEKAIDNNGANPLTLDNIIKYFVILFIGISGMIFVGNKMVLKKSR